MAHRLLQKRALDAVNEELLAPTRDPRADAADYNSPFQAKGTEFSPTKMGRQFAKEQECLMLAIEIQRQLIRLADMAPEGSVLQTTAEMDGKRLKQVIGQEQNGSRQAGKKRSEVEQHKSPKMLPPRNDMRRHMDEEVKKEMEEDKR